MDHKIKCQGKIYMKGGYWLYKILCSCGYDFAAKSTKQVKILYEKHIKNTKIKET